jgi:hypothetical protein
MEFTAPLTIHLAASEPTGGYRPKAWPRSRNPYIATCPQWPGLEARDVHPFPAIADLLELIERAQEAHEQAQSHPDDCDDCDGCDDCVDCNDCDEYRYEIEDPDGTVDEPSHIAEWNSLVRAANGEWNYRIHFYTDDEEFRHTPAKRNEWSSTGIPADVAQKFRAMLLEPADAKRLHDAGRTPEEVIPYVVNAESTGWWNWPDFNIVEWVITRIPVDRVRLYESRCSPVEATAWEGLSVLHGIGKDDLVAILRAGFTPASVAANARAWADAGHSIGDAARTYISAAGLDRRPIRIVSGRSH